MSRAEITLFERSEPTTIARDGSILLLDGVSANMGISASGFRTEVRSSDGAVGAGGAGWPARRPKQQH
jgi:hypothetical protein